MYPTWNVVRYSRPDLQAVAVSSYSTFHDRHPIRFPMVSCSQSAHATNENAGVRGGQAETSALATGWQQLKRPPYQ